MYKLTENFRHLISVHKDTEYVLVAEQFLLDLTNRIKFLEARQTELQELGTLQINKIRYLKNLLNNRSNEC